MEDCIFCKIVKGEIPCYKVYEDDDFLAFLDIKPVNPGHVLVIPKKHYRWVWQVPMIGKYFEVVKLIEQSIEKNLKPDFVTSVVWGEEVPHAHVWLVPRFSNDGISSPFGGHDIKNLSEEEMKQIAEKLSKFI